MKVKFLKKSEAFLQNYITLLFASFATLVTLKSCSVLILWLFYAPLQFRNEISGEFDAFDRHFYPEATYK